MPRGRSNKRYTPEFKRTVVETMREEHLSIREVMRRFEINDHGIIERWERIYLEEGPEGLAVERQSQNQGKVKGPAACTPQTTSPFGCLNFFYCKILSNFLGSLQMHNRGDFFMKKKVLAQARIENQWFGKPILFQRNEIYRIICKEKSIAYHIIEKGILSA